MAKYYSSMRGFADTGNNIWPLGDYLLRNVPVQEVTTPVATLKAKVDEAIANKTWVVFTFHDIRPNPSQNPDDYQYGTAELDQLGRVREDQGGGRPDQERQRQQGPRDRQHRTRCPNPTFNNGIADGWRTDAPAAITADAANNGSFPDAARSVKLVSGTATGHLFSPAGGGVSRPRTTCSRPTSTSPRSPAAKWPSTSTSTTRPDTWISGQYRKRENSRWVEAINFTYTPSSTNVATASLQVIVAGTGITAYVDNVQLLALGAETPPPPTSTNLVANGTFDAGISSGWTTDSAPTIVADAANHGSPANPVNSVKLTATTANKHLFSPQVAVTPGATTSPGTSTSRREPAVRWASTSTSTTRPGNGSPGSTNSAWRLPA